MKIRLMFFIYQFVYSYDNLLLIFGFTNYTSTNKFYLFITMLAAQMFINRRYAIIYYLNFISIQFSREMILYRF